MQITIIALGNKMPNWIEHGFQEYSKRFNRGISINLKELSATRRSNSISLEKLLSLEAEKINSHIPNGAYSIALDEHGKQQTTIDLSNKIDRWMKDGTHPCLIIGGADGLDKKIISQAKEIWSLSKLTMPHALVRVLLLEQLYRAWSILNNHPYHRE